MAVPFWNAAKLSSQGTVRSETASSRQGVGPEARPVDPQLTVNVRRRDGAPSLFSRPFNGPYLVVGRRDDCDVRLNHPSVSPRHLYLQKLPGRILAIDLGSSDYGRRTGVLSGPNRTVVDVLMPGDEVQVGEFLLSCEVNEPQTWSPRVPDAPLPVLPRPFAVWTPADGIRSDADQNRWVVRHEVTLIGRGPQCRWRIIDDSVSTTHASLVVFEEALHVIDLCSRHGVFVNGEPVRFALLNDGDVLTIGSAQGVVRLAGNADNSVERRFGTDHVMGRDSDAGNAESRGDDPDRLEEPMNVMVGDAVTVRVASDSETPPQDTFGIASADSLESDLPALVMTIAERHKQLQEHTQRLMEMVRRRLEMTARGRGVSKSAARAVLNSPSKTPNSSAAPDVPSGPELHAWLNRQLQDLDEDDRGGLRQFWDSLIGRS